MKFVVQVRLPREDVRWLSQNPRLVKMVEQFKLEAAALVRKYGEQYAVDTSSEICDCFGRPMQLKEEVVSEGNA